MKSRVIFVFSAFAVVWSLLLLRVFVIQVFPHEKLERLETKQYETTVKIEGRRGSIYDRRGVELAMSAPAYSLYADPQLLWSERKEVARHLQKILGIKPRDFLKLSRDKKKRFVWIERQLSMEQMEKINHLKIRGLGFIEEPIRVYPDEDILKPILGVVGRSGVGLEGVEKQYDSVLRGNPKKVHVRRDARGRPLQVNGLLVTEVEEGADVQLTIDRELQYVLHRELLQTVSEQEASGAVGVILNAQTSEILAMDGVGLTMGGEALEVEKSWRNRPILEAFEPGSTMKTFIIAAGLQQKGWQPNTRFDCENGKLKIGKRIINEADTHHKFGWLTISEILAFSSNIGMAKMAFDLGEKSVRDILYKFGFGQKTGVDLPGESKGIIQSEKWSQHLLSNVSFGHGMAATPLQITNAYAAVANGGFLRVPRVTKRESSKLNEWNIPWLEGEDKKSEEEGLRILSAAEAQTLRLLLAGVVVSGGTGFSAIVPGYPVAGKTGTAQKVNPKGRGYLPDAYISSFVGMIPANDPRFVIYVAVDSPQKQYYGSQVAAPLFSRIATFAVRHEGLAPKWLNEQQAQGLLPERIVASKSEPQIVEEEKTNDQQKEEITSSMAQMPNLMNLTLREVQEQLQNRELHVKLHGSGRVSRFIPAEGEPLRRREFVEIWLTE